MKLLYYIDTLRDGGAARLLSLISSELSRRGHEIYIATNTFDKVAYDFDDKIHFISLYPEDAYKGSRFVRFIKLLKNARTIAKQIRPDAITTLIPSVTFYTKIATLGLRVPTVFWDVTSYARKEAKFSHFVRWHFYNLGDKVVIETENDRRLLGDRIPQKVIINNPFSYPIYEGPDCREKYVLAIGPADEWSIKGFDMLIEAFGMIANKHTDWVLKIAGRYDEKSLSKLQPIIERYSIQDRVQFIGFQKHIDQVMQRCGIYALSSRIEGFPMSLMEALSQGCPAVCFKIHGVVTEISENGKTLQLIDDGDIIGFSNALDTLINNDNLRQKLSKDSRIFVKKYNVESITSTWEDLYSKMIYNEK